MEKGLSYLSDLNLHGSVVLSGDEFVSRRALAGDVDIHNILLLVLHLSSSLRNYLLIK